MTTNSMNDLLNELQKMLGLDELGLNSDNACFLTFDETLVAIEYDTATERCTISSPVGNIPHDNKKDFYEELLDGNFFWKATSGATLSINREEEMVYLLYDFHPSHTSFQQFQHILENFIATSEEWDKKIINFAIAPETDMPDEKPEHAIKV